MAKASFHSLANELVLQIASNANNSSLLAHSQPEQSPNTCPSYTPLCPPWLFVAIIWVAMRSNLPLVKLLLDGGMHPDNGATDILPAALMIAVHERCFEIVELLILHGADINGHSNNNCGYEAVIHGATANSDIDMIKLLAAHEADIDAMKSDDMDSRALLHIAIQYGHLSAVQTLLGLGEMVDQDDSKVGESMIEIAEILVKAGAHSRA